MVQKIIPDVISNQKLQRLDPDASVKAAASLMGSNRISAILVLKNDRLIGIVTER
ncbi:MAG TPA: CBS domain-containing protein, partial [Rhodospirillales bacterium]|nr:CBS domain-containing protein [Rhodospirillales bacterium]